MVSESKYKLKDAWSGKNFYWIGNLFNNVSEGNRIHHNIHKIKITIYKILRSEEILKTWEIKWLGYCEA